MTAPQLFVVVATGQRVANLPPVLERAEPGDHVLWVESPEAQKGCWSVGPRQVFEGHGLVNVPKPICVQQINDPIQLAQACQPVAAAFHDRGFRPVLVANGGQKLTPLGLLRAWRPLNPVLLYGDDRPAALWTFENGPEQPPTIRAYSRHNLHVDDVLAASDHLRVGGEDGPARRVWPDTPLPDDVSAERYGVDAEYTAGLHRSHHEWASDRCTSAEPPRFTDVVTRLTPDRVARWRRTLRGEGETIRLGAEADIYHGTLNLMRDAVTAAARLGLTPPAVRLGPSLERAVARRIVAWLGADAVRSRAVQSVWLNVCLAETRTPERTRAQFDVLLVLRNGILIYLECKAAAELVQVHDLDRRLLNLQRAASQLAQMAVCLPLYTTWCDEPWFANLHTLRLRLEEVGRQTFLPVTIANQPPHYPVGGRDYECVSLEQGLDRLLKPYLLQA